MVEGKLARSVGPILLAGGVVAIALSILLFASFSIYLSRAVEHSMPWVSDGSAFLYGIAFTGLLGGTGIAIGGFLRVTSGITRWREALERAIPGRPGTEDPVMKRAVLIELWSLPFMSVFFALAVQMAVIGGLYSRLVGFMAAGFLLLVIGGLAVLFRGLLQSEAVRIGFFVVNVALLVFLTWLTWLAAFTGYRLIWGFAGWGTGFGLRVVLQDRKGKLQATKAWRQRLKTWSSDHFSSRQYKTVASYTAILALFAGPGALLMTAPAWNCQTHEFTVTPQQAQQADLVMYYTSGFYTHHYVVDIAKEFNVTLTLGWNNGVGLLNTTNGTAGQEMVQFMKYANEQGVPIEIFQTYQGYHWEDFLAGQAGEGVWTLFKSWLVDNNVTVQYMLWDIEDGSRPSDITGMDAFFPFVEIRGLAQRTRELPAVRAQFERLVADAAAMGVKTRITTFGPSDTFDGDDDTNRLGGLISYAIADLIANESVDYVSTMAYTNHWGDIPPEEMGGYESVYENARMQRHLHPNHVGIDIGNINGAGETTIESVVDQVNLAIAGGATSVRLFNGASWVNGWSYVVEGPEWGYDGTRALFAAIRQGGTTRYTENTTYHVNTFQPLFLDCVLNIMKM
nr:hypothetical protein [Candidatus Sigynarchaeota archaeon]